MISCVCLVIDKSSENALINCLLTTGEVSIEIKTVLVLSGPVSGQRSETRESHQQEHHVCRLNLFLAYATLAFGCVLACIWHDI